MCLVTAAAQSQPTWDRLGYKECYGETCELDEFCSDNSDRGNRCRMCSEILESSEDARSWCHDNRIEELRQKYPSCEALCLRDRMEKLTQKVQGLENETKRLNHSLDEERQTVARLESEIKATGAALTKALADPCKHDLEALSEKFVAQANELNATENVLGDTRAAELKSKHELDRLRSECLTQGRELNTTRTDLQITQDAKTNSTEQLDSVRASFEHVTKENDDLKNALKECSDKVYVLTIVAGVCASLLALLFAGCLIRCAWVWLKGRKREQRANTIKQLESINIPHESHRQDSTQLRPLLPPTANISRNPTNNAHTPHANNDHRFGNNIYTNISDNDGRREPGKVTNVQATPTPAQTASESSGCSSGGTPSSSSSSLSNGKLCPSGDRTEAHLDDHKDFAKTAEFQSG